MFFLKKFYLIFSYQILSIRIIGYADLVHDIYQDGQYNQYLDLYYNSETALERGVHWLYNFFDHIFLYDFKITYNLIPGSILDDSMKFDKFNYEMGVWELSSNSLYWSIILDKKNTVDVYSNPYLNEWFYYYVHSINYSIAFHHHPELYIINDSIVNTLILPYTTNLFTVLKNTMFSEGYLNPLIILVNLYIYLFFVIILISFFFSYYTNSNKDENIIDQDYFIAAMTVESEEEIASIDDTSLALIILLFIFGWFFLSNCIFLLNNIPELGLLYFSIPFLYYMIFLIPTMLLYDFGIFFLTYLRGSSTTASFAMELLYDYIAVGAFYIRLAVQSVRLLLMTFTFFSLYEFIMVFQPSATWVSNSENLWTYTYNNYNNYSTSYFILSIPTQLIHWVYELLHTFFVVTAQFIAFFAMIFWLFLFLYTMFIWEQNERYFSEKKKERIEKFNKIINLK